MPNPEGEKHLVWVLQAYEELENGLPSLVAKTDLEMASQFREERHWSPCSDVVVQILK